ncbi:hypothetical protein BpHYR1_015806, partial [Brachionus plicatilis]
VPKIYRPSLNARTSQDEGKYFDNAAVINRSISMAAKAVEMGMKADGLSRKFLYTLDNFLLHQAVRNPTFLPANNEPVNVLDLVIVDKPDRIDIHLTSAPLGKARQVYPVIEFMVHLSSSNTPKYESSRFNYV